MRILPVLLFVFLAGCSNIPADYLPQEGDIVFQSLPQTPLVRAIEGVTLSRYSHCGIVARDGRSWVVIEAIGPVKETPLSDWIGRGRAKMVDVYRMEAELAPKIPEIIRRARAYAGRPYDIRYRFDDERIYCSELIYKAVKQATGIEMGKVERLGDLNWQEHEAYIRSIEGYVPLDREMITPKALSQAKQLTHVYPKNSTPAAKDPSRGALLDP